MDKFSYNIIRKSLIIIPEIIDKVKIYNRFVVVTIGTNDKYMYKKFSSLRALTILRNASLLILKLDHVIYHDHVKLIKLVLRKFMWIDNLNW